MVCASVHIWKDRILEISYQKIKLENVWILSLLTPSGFDLFSCTEGNEFIPKVAKEKGLKTMVGAWISDDKAKNKEEIAALINLANQGYVDVAVVGNEVLLRNELSFG